MPLTSRSLSRLLAGLSLVVSAVTAGASFAACSSTKAGGHADAGRGDAAQVDASDEVTIEDAGPPPDDVIVYPEAPSMVAPDGCLLLGAFCLDQSMCCSNYCVEASCSGMIKQM